MSGPDSLAVALLAGGRSRRFGSDKALFVPPGSVEPMWRLQLDKLSALGAAEVIVSVAAGPESPGFSPPGGVRMVPDRLPDQGPLGGLAAVLGEMRSDRVLVLGIDMPGATVEGMRRLVEAAGGGPDGRGLVPRLGGRWEPLLAIYPRALNRVAEERLAAGRRSLQGFVDAGVSGGWVEPWPVPPGCEEWFVNLNHPDPA